MDKGAGIAMCCTFGDVTDVEWWRDLKLPTRPIIQRNGRIVMDTPDWIEDPAGREVFAETAGKTTFSARKIIVDKLRESGDLDGEPTPTKRMTNFYEKGDKPLEIVTSRQWYLKNGGTDAKLNAELIERGKELEFHPDFMRVRYENWVHGLNGDWLISRQRFFGVPFPLWYPVNASGEPDYDHPITPSEDRLPIDPTIDVPEGYDESQRDVPGGFTAEKDIMDTWATSSLTPQIVTHWAEPDEAPRPCSLPPSRWTCARRVRTSSAPGCSRLWTARTWRTSACRGPMPRCPAGFWTPTTRRCRSPRATSWCRTSRSRSSARTPCVTGPPPLA